MTWHGGLEPADFKTMKRRKTYKPTPIDAPSSRMCLAASCAVSLGLAAVGAWMMVGVVDNYDRAIETAAAPGPTVHVVASIRDLNIGVAVQGDDLFMIELPRELFNPDMVTDPLTLVGTMPKERLLANEFVRRSRLADPERGIGLNTAIPTDMRALSLVLTDGAALSGHLRAGDHVDVLLTVKGESEANAIAEGLYVLSVNEESFREMSPQDSRRFERRQPPSVTFLVSPADAETLVQSEQDGRLRLALRSPLLAVKL